MTIFPDKEQTLGKFFFLYEMNKAILRTIKLDNLLNIVLSALTMGKGFGFNRAMIFLVEDDRQVLKGIRGMGPEGHEDAAKIWAELSRMGSGIQEFITFVEEKENFPESLVEKVTRDIEIPLSEKNNILIRTLREERAFNITYPEEGDLDLYLGEKLYHKIGVTPFITSPLISKGKGIGVVLADNYFTGRPITEEDMISLNLFTGIAGAAIENAFLHEELLKTMEELKKVQSRLIKAERLDAVGEVIATIVHEIKNPLTAIGGFIRIIQKEDNVEKAKEYAGIVLREVQRLEKLLHGTLSLSKDPLTVVTPCSLEKTVIDDVLTLYSEEMAAKGLKTNLEIEEAIPYSLCHAPSIKQAIINIFNNAIDVMDAGGTLGIRIYSREDNFIVIEISDTGPGISPDLINHIFDPFFYY